MWPNPQFPADLVHLLKKSVMENFIFCAVVAYELADNNNGKTRLINDFHFNNRGIHRCISDPVKHLWCNFFVKIVNVWKLIDAW